MGKVQINLEFDPENLGTQIYGSDTQNLQSRITMIKELRSATGMNLKDAKEIIDLLVDKTPVPPNDAQKKDAAQYVAQILSSHAHGDFTAERPDALQLPVQLQEIADYLSRYYRGKMPYAELIVNVNRTLRPF